MKFNEFYCKFFYILRKISYSMFNFFVIVNKVLKNEILEKNLGLLKKGWNMWESIYEKKIIILFVVIF